jgi:hypothetical protein
MNCQSQLHRNKSGMDPLSQTINHPPRGVFQIVKSLFTKLKDDRCLNLKNSLSSLKSSGNQYLGGSKEDNFDLNNEIQEEEKWYK